MCTTVRNTFALAALALMFTASSSVAQATDPSSVGRASFKEPGTATLIGVLVPGGGQLYAGKITKGLTLLAVGYGSIIAGTVAAVETCDIDGCSRSLGLLYAGYAGYLASWIYGFATAGRDAHEVNASNGYQRRASIAPIVTVGSDNRPAVGVALTMRFGR